jgi:hypothetical protein
LPIFLVFGCVSLSLFLRLCVLTLLCCTMLLSVCLCIFFFAGFSLCLSLWVYASVIVGFSLCLLLCVYVFASYSLRGCPCLLFLRWKKKEQMQNRHARELQALVVAHARDKVRGRLHYVIVGLSVFLFLCGFFFVSVIVGLCICHCGFFFVSFSLRLCLCVLLFAWLSLLVCLRRYIFFLIVFALIWPCWMRQNKGTDSQSP